LKLTTVRTPSNSKSLTHEYYIGSDVLHNPFSEAPRAEQVLFHMLGRQSSSVRSRWFIRLKKSLDSIFRSHTNFLSLKLQTGVLLSTERRHLSSGTRDSQTVATQFLTVHDEVSSTTSVVNDCKLWPQDFASQVVRWGGQSVNEVQGMKVSQTADLTPPLQKKISAGPVRGIGLRTWGPQIWRGGGCPIGDHPPESGAAGRDSPTRESPVYTLNPGPEPAGESARAWKLEMSIILSVSNLSGRLQWINPFDGLPTLAVVQVHPPSESLTLTPCTTTPAIESTSPPLPVHPRPQ
jgi:hypothetical protein